MQTTFGAFIKKKRIEENLALREVCAAIELDQSLLSKIERDKMIAPQRIIKGLANILGQDYEELQILYLSEKLFKEFKHMDFILESLQLALKRIEFQNGDKKFVDEKQNLINRITDYFVDKPIDKVWVFGSFARGEERIDSDIDLLIKFKKPNKIDLFDYVGIRQDLEDLTGREIDLVEEGQELDKIKPFILKDRKLIYERKAI